jgi:hypothetical protein
VRSPPTPPPLRTRRSHCKICIRFFSSLWFVTVKKKSPRINNIEIIIFFLFSLFVFRLWFSILKWKKNFYFSYPIDSICENIIFKNLFIVPQPLPNLRKAKINNCLFLSNVFDWNNSIFRKK